LLELDGLCDFVPGIGCAGVLGIGLESRAQMGFVGGLDIHDGLVEQAGLVTGDGFLRILQTENIFLGDAGAFFRLLAEILQQSKASLEQRQVDGILHIAHELKLGHGEQAAGIAGISGDEDQVAIFYASARPTQVVIEMSGLVIFVDSEESDVQIVARVGEVVGVAAEEGDAELRREDEAYVGVFFIFVEVVNLAGVKDHHVAAQSGRGGAIFLDLRHGGALRLRGFGGRHLRLHAGVDLVGHVLNAYELIEFEIGAFGLFGLSLGVEAGLDVVVAFGGKLLHASRPDVVIGEGQAVGRNEGAGATVIEAHRRKANMVEPLLGELESVFGFDAVFWGSVIEPHALVGRGQSRVDTNKGEQNRKNTLHFG
jgi:hypothetical protein